MTNEKVNKTFTFVWEIDNYTSCFLEENQPIRSPVFSSKYLAGDQWHLELYPRSTFRNGNASLYLIRITAKNSGNILVDYEMAITVESENVVSFKGQKLFSEKDSISETYEILREEVTNTMENCDKDTLSISCAMTTNNLIHIRNEAIGCEAKTKIGVNRCSFVWNVDEPDTSDWTQSIECPYPDICPIKITLTSPQEDIETNIRLLKGKSQLSRYVSVRIALLDMVGIERYSKRDKMLFSSNTKNWKFPSFLKKSQLKNERNNFLENGVFSLMCHFTNSDRIDSMEIVKYTYDIHVDPLNSRLDNFSTLNNDLTAMFKNRDHSDVNLQTSGEEFPAHKVILATRSPVFSAMFKRNMVESQTGVVDIHDVDANTLKSFLEFLYTDTLSEIEYESASKLLIVADKYQVVSLKEKCSSFLMSVLSAENVCEVLSMADMVGHKLLKHSTIDFIKAHSRKILPSSEWSELIKSNCQLASEVLHKFSAVLEKATLK